MPTSDSDRDEETDEDPNQIIESPNPDGSFEHTPVVACLFQGQLRGRVDCHAAKEWNQIGFSGNRRGAPCSTAEPGDTFSEP
jgi:hypothetical protein